MARTSRPSTFQKPCLVRLFRGIRGPRLIPLAVVSALVISACGSSSSKTAATTSNAGSGFTLRVGDLMPFTGPLSPYGPPLAEDGLSKKYAVKIVDTEDTGDSVATALEGAQKLVSSGVNVIVGTLDSTTTVGVAESVSLPDHILQITPTSSSTAITKLPDHLVFQVNVPDSFQVAEIVAAMHSVYGTSAVVNLGYSNDESDSSSASLFEQEWKHSGGKIGQVVGWNLNSPNYTSVADDLVTGHPTAWLILTFPQEYQKVATALAQTGKWSPARTFAAEDMRALPVLHQLGPKLAGGLRGIAPAIGDTNLQRTFADQFAKRFPHVQATGYEPFAYDSVVVAFLAALKAKSVKGPAISAQIPAVTNPPGHAYTYLNLAAAIRAVLAGQSIHYEGVSGPLDIGSSNAPTEALYSLWEYTPAGKLVTLKTATATG